MGPPGLRIEMATSREKRCGDDLEAYRVAVQLPGKWIQKKSAGDLVELFFRHYRASHKEKAVDASKYRVAVEGPTGSGVVELENSASVAEVVASSQKLWLVVPEPLISELSAEDKVRALCLILEEMPFRLLTGLLYRVIAGRIESLDRIKDEERLFYSAFRDVVFSSSLHALRLGVDAVLQTAQGSSVTRAVCHEIIQAKQFIISVPEPKRRLLEKFEGFDILPRRDELCHDVFGLSIPLRTKWRPASEKQDMKTTTKNHTTKAAALSYFIRSFYSPRGDILLYETITALANYIRQRLRVRPIDFRPTVIQINARDGRFAAFLSRACGSEEKIQIIPTDFREKIATSSVNILPDGKISDLIRYFKRPSILINIWSYLDDDAWLTQCKQIVPDEEFEPLDIPEIVLLGPTADLGPRFLSSSTTTEKKSENHREYTPAPKGARPHEERIDWKPFEGYDLVHLEEVSRQMLHVDDLTDDTYGHSCCVSLRSRGSTLTTFRNEDEIKYMEAQSVLAGAMADAQRGQFNPMDRRRARELQLAQEFLEERQKKIMEEYQKSLGEEPSSSAIPAADPSPPPPPAAAASSSDDDTFPAPVQRTERFVDQVE